MLITARGGPALRPLLLIGSSLEACTAWSWQEVLARPRLSYRKRACNARKVVLMPCGAEQKFELATSTLSIEWYTACCVEKMDDRQTEEVNIYEALSTLLRLSSSLPRQQHTHRED